MRVDSKLFRIPVQVLTLLCVISPGLAFSQPTKAAVRTSLGKLPLYFVENQGVYPEAVKFYIHGADKTLFFTKDGITFRLKGKDRGWVVKLEFMGANPDVVPQGEDRQQAVFSYFKGPEKDWKAGLSSYAKVVYRELWPGIDLVYRGTVNKLKYEFVVAPGADSKQIRLQYRGVEKLKHTETGALCVETSEGSFEDTPPVAWQDVDGKRVLVEMAYALGEGSKFGFSLGKYDTKEPLILDPAVIVYCGYIGGVKDDTAVDVAVDSSGNAYVVGTAASTEATFPVKSGPFVKYGGQGGDAFVAKVNAMGTALVYCGYIGGTHYDDGRSIAVDAAGNAYVTGVTDKLSQANFPVKTGPVLTHNGPGWDGFVAKVNTTGTTLVYCGYIGGSGSERAQGIAVDAAGNAYVTGWTESDEKSFPVKVGPDLSHNGSMWDAFVAKVNTQGTGFDYCGYIGGSNFDIAYDVDVDTAGSILRETPT